MEDKRDQIDELFRSKLYDFEPETMTGDWDAIADRLPEKPSVPLRRRITYWAAAAMLALLLGVSGLFLFDREIVNEPVAQEIQKETRTIERRIAEDIKTTERSIEEKTSVKPAIEKSVIAEAGTFIPFQLLNAEDVVLDSEIEQELDVVDEELIQTKAFADITDDNDDAEDPQSLYVAQRKTLLTDDNVQTEGKSKPPRRWGLGMGAGSIGMNANNVIPQYVTNSSGFRAEALQYLNAVSDYRPTAPKTNVKHKMPLSFGLGVSYLLSDRWALQSGITYTFLSSEWDVIGDKISLKETSALHYLGIPISLTYRFADWNKFSFYGSVGAMGEKNIAGRLKTKIYSDNEFVSSITESVKMKELMWSVNARAGAAYPLLSFLSAYAEIAANYYFDNGSDIETIRSEKPFNVGLQIGLRLGF